MTGQETVKMYGNVHQSEAISSILTETPSKFSDFVIRVVDELSAFDLETQNKLLTVIMDKVKQLRGMKAESLRREADQLEESCKNLK